MIEDTPLKFTKPIKYLSTFQLGATSGLNSRLYDMPEDLITCKLLQFFMLKYNHAAKQQCTRAAMNWYPYR